MNTGNQYSSQIVPQELLKQEEELLSENKMKSTSRKQMEFLMESNFHRTKLNEIKRLLGSKCTYLSHLHQSGKKTEEGWVKGDFYFIKAVMKNEIGGKDTIMYEIEGTPRGLTKQDYSALYDNLKQNVYVSKGS